MKSEDREATSTAQGSLWSTRPILLWGTFGTKSPAERRYIRRSCLAAAVVVIWALLAFALHFRPRPLTISIEVVAGVAITYVAFEGRRYLRQLDELARHLQLEAMAWTYLTGFVLAGWVAVLAMLFSHAIIHWRFSQALFFASPFLYFLLAPVCAGWLYYLSRRY